MTVQVQIHGYRKGHQLLASSVTLSKEDQAVVDRLSDVAGPLRPKEQFAPYLSAYPLPSGTYYVVARTWQDDSTSRAGCVRTKSVMIDAQAWSFRPPLIPVLRLLSSTDLPVETEAVSTMLEEQFEVHLPPATSFSASELLEALFLEDVKPVVVFDAPDPELIVVRLITALWPNIRSRFALSTFALSPRKIGGRDLDLVFAPSNAKAKFSGWLGRRVDGRLSQTGRHRWTEAIVRRVFEEPIPRLLSDRGTELLGERDADSATALRIALLWEELLNKLEQTPTAALGLLDISNSGMVNNAAATKILEPRLAEAMLRATATLPPPDAWDFVSAIAHKLQGHRMPSGWTAVKQLAVELSEKAPEGALNLLQQPDPKGTINNLTPSIAMGLGNAEFPRVKQLLAEVSSDIIARLVSQGENLTSRIAWDEGLIKRMGAVLTEVDQDLADQASMMLLPFLVDDCQISTAIPIFNKLDRNGIAEKLQSLGSTGDFEAKQLCSLLVERAREIGCLSVVRNILVSSDTSERRDALLALTLEPVAEDVLWLLGEKRLTDMASSALLVGMLQRADNAQFSALLSNPAVNERMMARLPDNAIDIFVRALKQDSLPINTHINIICSVLPMVEGNEKLQIAKQVLGRCLRNRFHRNESEVLLTLLSIIGAQLNGSLAAKTGLERSNSADVASRNLIVFEGAAADARMRMVEATGDIARALQERHYLDLTEAAIDACAKLMFDAKEDSASALVDEAGCLMPLLLRNRRQPVSSMIAVLFPVIYRRLLMAKEVPDLLNFVPFFDWDRCKAARKELVEAFMTSSWKPSDLALTALRCGDVSRILKRVAKSYGGDEYLARIENDLDPLSDDERYVIERTLAEIKSDRFYDSG